MYNDLIQPVEVKRDTDGYWSHPFVPVFAGTDAATDDSPKWQDWLAQQGLEQSFSRLADEDESHPAYVSYFEHESANASAWEPQPPQGDGWFLLGIDDTEDGPCAWFVRRDTWGSAQQ